MLFFIFEKYFHLGEMQPKKKGKIWNTQNYHTDTERGGLIVCSRDGKEVYYRAADAEQSRLLHQMIEQVMEITCPRL